MRIKIYQLIQKIVEVGAEAGYNRAHKHTDTPDFLEEIRHQLYMYLEPSMEELVMDSYQDLIYLDRLVMGSH